MVGGAPILTPPGMYPTMPMNSYPAPRFVPPAAPQPAAPVAWQQPAAPPAWQPPNNQLAQAPQTAPRQPLVRMQAPDEMETPARSLPPARPEPLRLPAPEELGVGSGPSGAAAAVDWADVHRRLDRLGAVSFQQQKLVDGACRITFLLPTQEAGRTHCIEAEAGDPAGAVRLALERAERWAGQR